MTVVDCPARLKTCSRPTAVAAIRNRTATYAERSVLRMRASTLPMPPLGARPTGAEIAAFETWVDAGAPEGQCEP